MEIRNKKAAFEMSMSTIIIIVLSVVFLILGLVLLRSIFQTATTSIDNIDSKLQDQLNTIFAQEDKPYWMKPDDGVLKVRSATTNFGFILGGRSKNNIDVKRGDMQYRFLVDKASPDNCYTKLGNNEAKIKSWFPGSRFATDDNDLTNLNKLNYYQDDMGWDRIQISIPSGTILCTQKILYDIYDTSDTTLGPVAVGGGSFTLEILRKAIV
jgi:hypothetical protein